LLLPPGPLADAFMVRHLEKRLHRRVIDIREGLLVLHPYMDREVADSTRRLGETAGLQDVALEAVVAAAQVAAALHHTRWRVTLPRPDDAPDPTAIASAPQSPAGEQVNWDLDVPWLEAVSTAYAASPLVRQALVDAGVTDPGAAPGQT
jgi:Family of unknown function (DUF6545)